MINLLLVAAGGALGASLRFLTSIFFKYFFHNSILGTLVANVIGSFLIGLFIYLIQNKNVSEDIIKYLLIIGMLGSYTTFSAFSFETVELLINKKILIAFFYVTISLILCIIAAYVGLNIQKIIN